MDVFIQVRYTNICPQCPNGSHNLFVEGPFQGPQLLYQQCFADIHLKGTKAVYHTLYQLMDPICLQVSRYHQAPAECLTSTQPLESDLAESVFTRLVSLPPVLSRLLMPNHSRMPMSRLTPRSHFLALARTLRLLKDRTD
jgi:hypothetical protein